MDREKKKRGRNIYKEKEDKDGIKEVQSLKRHFRQILRKFSSTKKIK